MIIMRRNIMGGVLIALSLLMLSNTTVFAAARPTPFAPGETLDPGADSQPCGPADINCFPSPLSTSDEGVTLSLSPLHLNFVGAGVTATQSGATTTVLIAGGSGITSLNGSTSTSQTFAVGTTGSDFAIVTNGGVHTFNIPTASATATRGLLTSADWSTFNNKQNAITAGNLLSFAGTVLNSTALASSSLASSSALALLLSDETGSGGVVFNTSPTFLGVPIFSGGGFNFSIPSTSTIPNNVAGAWSVATSSSGVPLLSIDTTSGSESVVLGAAGAPVVIGSVGQSANLIFQENSLIAGAGAGRTITLGANGDIFNVAVNLGIGTTTPLSPLAVSGGVSIGADYNIAAPANGLIVEGNVGIQNSSPFYALDVGGYINTSGTNGGYKIDGATVLYATTTASYLVAVGPFAGNSLKANATSTDPTSGIYNTVIGYQAMNLSTSTNYSTAVGYRALKNVIAQTSAAGVDAFGYQALLGDTTGLNNAAFGGQALQSNTTGSQNIGVGAQAMMLNTTGANNIGIGYRALNAGVSDTGNVGVGYWALRYATSSSHNNVAIGLQAALGNSSNYTGASGNTVVGANSGFNFSSGVSYNTLLGYQTGYDLTSGTNNTVVGQSKTTGGSITSGSGNILIGNSVISGIVPTGNNQLNIGNLIFGSGLTSSSTLSSGNVGIGSSTPGSILSIGNTNGINFTTATTTFYSTGGINLTSGCFAINGACVTGGGGAYTFAYPLVNTANTISLAFGTTTANSWSAAQTLTSFENFAPASGNVLAKFNNSNFLLASTSGVMSFGLSSGVLVDYATSTAFGYKALQTATSSVLNTAIGYAALSHVQDTTGGLGGVGSGSNNSAVGSFALQNLTTGVSNSAFGYNTLAALVTGTNNTGVGSRSLELTTTGTDNVAIGFRALGNNVTGGGNIGIGSDAGRYNQSPTSTVAIGYQTAGGITATSFAGVAGYTIIGYQAGGRIAPGSQWNTFLGYSAGNLVTSGADNILIGAASTTSNDNLTTGSQNIKIGDNISFASTTANGQLNIQNIIFGTGNLAVGAVVSTGNIGIGTATPSAQLTTTGSVRFANFGAGTLTTDANGNLSVSSDERLKDIQGSFTRGSAAILGLAPISYHWKSETGFDTASLYTGFSAQNVQQYIPEAIGTNKDGFLTLSDRPILATVVNAIKEILARLDGLSTQTTTHKLCLDDVCVTKTELKELLDRQNIMTPPGNPAVVTPSGTTMSPTTDTGATSTPTVTGTQQSSSTAITDVASTTTP
jgi:hypothetical protein